MFTVIRTWRRRESNSQPPPCKGGALPIELRPLAARPTQAGRTTKNYRDGPGYPPAVDGLPVASSHSAASAAAACRRRCTSTATPPATARSNRILFICTIHWETAIRRPLRPYRRRPRWAPETRTVGLGGLEPPTSSLSGKRSNRLSYRPANTTTAPRFLDSRSHGAATIEVTAPVQRPQIFSTNGPAKCARPAHAPITGASTQVTAHPTTRK